MLGFLQGFSYGLFMTCLPWLLVGLFNPGLAVPVAAAGRLHVVLRYCLAVPFISMLLWLTSLWGGFSPSLLGWLAGIVAIPVALPIERTLRGWLARRRARRQQAEMTAKAQQRRAQQARNAHEAGVLVLDPAAPPEGADDLVMAMCHAKQRLLDVQRPDLAILADRLYSRYHHVMHKGESHRCRRSPARRRERALFPPPDLGRRTFGRPVPVGVPLLGSDTQCSSGGRNRENPQRSSDRWQPWSSPHPPVSGDTCPGSVDSCRSSRALASDSGYSRGIGGARFSSHGYLVGSAPAGREDCGVHPAGGGWP